MKQAEEGGNDYEKARPTDRGRAMRGQSIRDVAARLMAEASEHHGDGAEVRAVLMCAFVEDGDEGGFVYMQHATPGEGEEEREAVKRALRDWIAAIDDPEAEIGLGPDETEG